MRACDVKVLQAKLWNVTTSRLRGALTDASLPHNAEERAKNKTQETRKHKITAYTVRTLLKYISRKRKHDLSSSRKRRSDAHEPEQEAEERDRQRDRRRINE